jgi:hypothetical protein
MITQTNIDKLAELISKKLHVKINFNMSVRNDRLRIVSQDFKDELGIMTPFYEYFVLQDFGGKISEDKESYWLPVHFAFEYKTGGSNGHQLCDAWFNFKEQNWILHYNHEK